MIAHRVDQPLHLFDRLAGVVFPRVRVQSAKRCIGEDHIALLVDDQHALGQRVECGANAIRNGGFGIQMLERAAQIQVEHQQAAGQHGERQDDARIAQPAHQCFRSNCAVGDFHLSPGAGRGVHRHDHAGQRGFVVGRLHPSALMIAGFRCDFAAHAPHRDGEHVRIAADHRMQRAPNAIGIFILRERRQLHREILARIFANLPGDHRLIGQHAEDQVRRQQQAASERNQAETDARDGAQRKAGWKSEPQSHDD
jgi:hypothetical protein